MNQHDTDPSPLLQMLVNYLTTPASDYYLPKVLSNNAVDPWSIKTLQLAPFQIMGNTTVAVTINNAVCTGLSDVEVTGHDITGDTAAFTAQLPNSTWTAVTTNYLHLYSDNVVVTLDDTGMPPGSISITVNTVDDVEGSFTLGVDPDEDINTLTVTFNELSVNPSTENKNIVIDLEIDTGFKSTINAILNEPAQLAAAIKAVNDELASQDTLDQLSKAATAAARQALQGILGGGS